MSLVAETVAAAAPASPAAPGAPERGEHDRPGPRDRAQPRATAAAWAAVLLVAAALRLPAVFAALPYLNYVDEGHVLHRVVHVLAAGDWDPGWYIYGALPDYAIAAAAIAYQPVYGLLHGHPLGDDLSRDPYRYYDLVEPREIIVLGRLLSLLLAVAAVALVGRLATVLSGPAAGLFAAWLAALLPALVIRGAVVNVDVYALVFSLAALLFAERLRSGPRPWRAAALAGAMTGLACVSKYPAVLVCLPVALAALTRPARWRERLGLLATAAAATLAGAFTGMPALALRTAAVFHAIAYEASLYAQSTFGSYWDQAVHRAEWDQPLTHPELGYPFLILAAAGLAAAVLDRPPRRPAPPGAVQPLRPEPHRPELEPRDGRHPFLRQAVLGWALFATALGLLLASYSFHPLRNLLAPIALACILVSFLYARVRRMSGRRRRMVDLAAAALPIVLFAAPLYQYDRDLLALRDSRREAIDWLAVHSVPEDSILFARELAFLKAEIHRLPAHTRDAAWPLFRRLVRHRDSRWVVLGKLLLPGPRTIPPQARQELFERYELRQTFGESHTPSSAADFHGNRQTILILERRPEAKTPAG